MYINLRNAEIEIFIYISVELYFTRGGEGCGAARARGARAVIVGEMLSGMERHGVDMSFTFFGLMASRFISK